MSKNAWTPSESLRLGLFAIVAVKVIFPELESETATVVTSGPSPLSPVGSVKVAEPTTRFAWFGDAFPTTGQRTPRTAARMPTATNPLAFDFVPMAAWA